MPGCTSSDSDHDTDLPAGLDSPVAACDPAPRLERTAEKPSPTVAAGLIAFFGVLYAVGSKVALRAFPYSGDEYSYFLQGELFARGLLKAPAPPNANLLWVDHVVIDQFVRSKYPPEPRRCSGSACGRESPGW